MFAAFPTQLSPCGLPPPPFQATLLAISLDHVTLSLPMTCALWVAEHGRRKTPQFAPSPCGFPCPSPLFPSPSQTPCLLRGPYCPRGEGSIVDPLTLPWLTPSPHGLQPQGRRRPSSWGSPWTITLAACIAPKTSPTALSHRTRSAHLLQAGFSSLPLQPTFKVCCPGDPVSTSSPPLLPLPSSTGLHLPHLYHPVAKRLGPLRASIPLSLVLKIKDRHSSAGQDHVNITGVREVATKETNHVDEWRPSANVRKP